MLLGFSTGCLYKTRDRLAPETFDVFRKLGCNAIELMWGALDRAPKLDKLSRQDFEGFEYISIHAPVFLNYNATEIAEIFKVLEIFNKKIKLDSVVLHPDGMTDWEVLKSSDLPFAIENMDNRKSSFKNAKDLKSIFDKVNLKMVLDLNHCYSNDPTMQLAKDLVTSFKDRICEVHLSGFETFHDPIYKTQQLEILKSIPDKNLPIIIESVLDDDSGAKQEYEYVKKYLEEMD